MIYDSCACTSIEARCRIRLKMAKLDDVDRRLGLTEQKLNHTVIVAAAAVTLLLAPALTWIMVSVHSHGERMAAIDIQLKSIAEQQQKMLPSVLRQLLDKPQSKEDIDQRLKVATSVLAAARIQKTRSDLPTLQANGKRLLEVTTQHPDLPSAWAASAEFVSYASLQQVQPVLPVQGMPQCTDLPGRARIKTVRPEGKNTVMTHGPLEFHDCQIVLDSEAASAKLSHDLISSDVLFERCIIIYRGGVLTLTQPPEIQTGVSLGLGNIYFKQCLFAITIERVPPPFGKHLTQVLLASTENTVKFDPRS